VGSVELAASSDEEHAALVTAKAPAHEIAPTMVVSAIWLFRDAVATATY